MQDLRTIVCLLPSQKWITVDEIRKITGYSVEKVMQGIDILMERGLPLERKSTDSYRLSCEITLIHEDRLTMLLKSAALLSSTRISVLDTVDSTNSRLLEWTDSQTLHGRVLVAEYQSSGRGRHGHTWCAVGYQNLTFSLAWRIDQVAHNLSTVSLVAGLSVCFCLEDMGFSGIGLRWPNDVVSSTGKLAGILVETKKTDMGSLHVVIGIGLNIDNTAIEPSFIDQPISGLAAMTHALTDRTEILARLLLQLSKDLEKFNLSGFADCAERWNERDAYLGYNVIGSMGRDTIHGRSLGISDSGAYSVLDRCGRVHQLISGGIRLDESDSKKWNLDRD